MWQNIWYFFVFFLINLFIWHAASTRIYVYAFMFWKRKLVLQVWNNIFWSEFLSYPVVVLDMDKQHLDFYVDLWCTCPSQYYLN